MSRKKMKIQSDCLSDDHAVSILTGAYYSLQPELKEGVAFLFAHGFRFLSHDGISFLRDCPDLLERVRSINPDLNI